jgi:hypothetical protein
VEFARAACLCQLRVAEPHDLPLLQDLFVHSGTPEDVISRSETLRMLLDLSRCRSSEAIGQDDFRQIIYFRELENSQYEPRAELVDMARRWRVYQGREYFGYVFNRLLRWVSRRGLAETDAGLTLCRGLVSGDWSPGRSTTALPTLAWDWRCPRSTRARASPASLMHLGRRLM